MQFFIFGRNFQQTAKILHDKHVLKLCIELYQILLIVTSILLEHEENRVVFAQICEQNFKIEQSKVMDYLSLEKRGYVNHPFVLYGIASMDNYKIMYSLSQEYYKEAKLRFNNNKKRDYTASQNMNDIIHTFIFQGYTLCRTYTQWCKSVPSSTNIPPICADEEFVTLYNKLLSRLEINLDFSYIRKYGPKIKAYIATTWKDYLLFQQTVYYYNNKGSGLYLHTDEVPSLLSEGPVLDIHINECLDRHDKIKTNCKSKIFYNKLYNEFLSQIDNQKEDEKDEEIMLMNYLLKLSKNVDTNIL